MPDDLYDKAAQLAARDRVSVEQFVSALLANCVASREFIDSRSRLFNKDEFEQALDQISNAEPDNNDRLNS